jgi:hypothetical protein
LSLFIFACFFFADVFFDAAIPFALGGVFSSSSRREKGVQLHCAALQCDRLAARVPSWQLWPSKGNETKKKKKKKKSCVNVLLAAQIEFGQFVGRFQSGNYTGADVIKVGRILLTWGAAWMLGGMFGRKSVQGHFLYR